MMRGAFCLRVIVMSLFTIFATPALATPAFQAGEWEITTRTEMPGLPFAAPAITTRQCLTLRDRIPQGKDATGGCSVVNQNSSGDTVQWTMRCDSPDGTTEARGEVTYSGTTMSGISHITTSGRGETVHMTSHMSGHRISPCK